MKWKLHFAACAGVLILFSTECMRAQMVPFTSSGVSSVTPFSRVELKERDHNEFAVGATYLASFGLALQLDYGIGNGSSGKYTTTESQREYAVRLGYFPVWAGPSGGFNLGVVAGYASGAFDDAADVRVFDEVDYSLEMSTSYTALVSDRLQIIPFLVMGWEVEYESLSNASSEWSRGGYSGLGTHIRYALGPGAVILTVQTDQQWAPLGLAARYVLPL